MSEVYDPRPTHAPQPFRRHFLHEAAPNPELAKLIAKGKLAMRGDEPAFTTNASTKSLGMGGHTLPNEGVTKVWLTPPSLLHRLGSFDLDPCAAPTPRPWPTAKKHIELPEDGLTALWSGRVYLNPPYDKSIDRWVTRMIEHGNGISLIFARTETAFWQDVVWPGAHGILFLAGRLFFHRPDGTRGSSNAGAPSALLAHSKNDVEILRHAGIPGVLTTRTERIGISGETV